jgi:hypothetical protein
MADDHLIRVVLLRWFRAVKQLAKRCFNAGPVLVELLWTSHVVLGSPALGSSIGDCSIGLVGGGFTILSTQS